MEYRLDVTYTELKMLDDALIFFEHLYNQKFTDDDYSKLVRKIESGKDFMRRMEEIAI